MGLACPLRGVSRRAGLSEAAASQLGYSAAAAKSCRVCPLNTQNGEALVSPAKQSSSPAAAPTKEGKVVIRRRKTDKVATSGV